MKALALRGAAAIAIAIALLVGGLYVAGATLDREHRVRVERVFDRAPADVFAILVDVEASREWRDLASLEVLSRDPLRWREDAGDGPIVFVVDERVEGRRLVTRIDDPELPFGGTWTYELTPTDAGGTRLAITEDGWIDPPLFRALTRWGWGYDASARAYLDALARRD